MNNPVEDNVCVLCGTPLIEPNDWYTCSQCTEKLKEKVLKARKNAGPRSPKRKVIFNPASTAWLREKQK